MLLKRSGIFTLNDRELYSIAGGGRWSCCICGRYYGDPDTKKFTMLDGNAPTCKSNCAKWYCLPMYGWDNRGLKC